MASNDHPVSSAAAYLANENDSIKDNGNASENASTDDESPMEEDSGSVTASVSFNRSISAPVVTIIAPLNVGGPRFQSQRTVSESQANGRTDMSEGKETIKRENLSVMDRYERRKLTNRKAAQKSRNKEKEKETRLTRESLEEESRRTSLKYEVRKLSNMVQSLTQILNDHKLNRHTNRCVLQAITNSGDLCNTSTCREVGSNTCAKQSVQFNTCFSAATTVQNISPCSTPTPTPPPTPNTVPFASYEKSQNGNVQPTTPTQPNATIVYARAQESVTHNTSTKNSFDGSTTHTQTATMDPSSNTLAPQNEQPHIYIPMDKFRQLAAKRVSEWKEGDWSEGPNKDILPDPSLIPNVSTTKWAIQVSEAMSITNPAMDNLATTPERAGLVVSTVVNPPNTTTTTFMNNNSETKQPDNFLPFSSVADINNYTVVASELTPSDILKEGLAMYVAPQQNGNFTTSSQDENTVQNAVCVISAAEPDRTISNEEESGVNGRAIAVSALLELNRGIVEEQ